MTTALQSDADTRIHGGRGRAQYHSLADTNVPPFPVLSDQIMKVKRREVRVAKG